MTLFDTAAPVEDSCKVEYFPRLFSHAERRDLLTALLEETRWRQDHIMFFGKSVPLPRLTAWYGDEGFTYTYSGISMEPETWTPTLRIIKDRVGSLCGSDFNSVLLNQYRNGQDKVSWHSDDEPELGPEPLIASVSFGATRRFKLRRKPHEKGNESVKVDLEAGSCLVMSGRTQSLWEHELAKTSQVVTPRVNLTFRQIDL